MKNFSEATATKIMLPVEIILEPVFFNDRRLERTLAINGQVLRHGLLQRAETFVFPIDLLSPLKVEITVEGKLPSDTTELGDTAILVKSIKVDGKEIIPLYQHIATPPNDYLADNGTWVLDINKPFYQWYHDITGQGWIA